MNLLRHVWAILQPHERRRSILILGLIIVATAVEMVSVGLVLPVLAFMTSNTEWLPPALRDRIAWFGNPGSYRAILLVLLGLVAVFAAKSVFLLCVAYCQARHVSAVQANVSRRLFATVLGQPWSFHLQRNSSSIAQVFEETQVFAQACMHLFQIGAELLVGVGLLALLLCVEPVARRSWPACSVLPSGCSPASSARGRAAGPTCAIATPAASGSRSRRGWPAPRK